VTDQESRCTATRAHDDQPSTTATHPIETSSPRGEVVQVRDQDRRARHQVEAAPAGLDRLQVPERLQGLGAEAFPGRAARSGVDPWLAGHE
jgi:hypothetical protein